MRIIEAEERSKRNGAVAGSRFGTIVEGIGSHGKSVIFLEIEVPAPSQASLNRETGESGPLGLKFHQPFCDMHATPFAVSSG